MERTWKFASLCFVTSFFKLCHGFPIHFERTIADPQIQVLSGVLAVVVTICTLLLIAGCLCCQRDSGFKEFRDSPVAISAVGNVETGLVNPTADGAFTIFAPLSQQNLSGSKERFRADEDYIYRDINVSSWFGEGERDFPRAKLKYIRELGKGWFGRVVEGTAQDLEAENTWTPVVVRILDSTAATKERVLFLHEADIYRCGEHTNILKLYGRCLDLAPFLLLQEFCPQGDLKSYLLSNRPNADNLLASEYPLIWCCQLTSAVKFLHEKGLAHSDLACRNCQLAANLTLKLGDYGLAAARYPEDYYEGAISVRWCAPESIRHTSTTIRSERVTREANVWSLAVCFWEVCECAERPYSHLNDDEVVERVLGKGCDRLGRPSKGVLYTDYIYRLMQSCWLTPESRPTATQIYLTLTDLLQVFTVCKAENEAGSITDSQESRESFDARWNSLKPNVLKESEGVAAKTSGRAGSKPTSPSLNNLIGSLEDMNGSRTSDEYNANSVLLPASSNQKFEFKLGPQSKEPLDTDSLNDSMIYTMRRSSSSETEEENWKRKIERGAYTEKVRQKSRSVTDLMVLTHIDYSESESETPQPSLDHRVNYKNVRLAPKHNLDGASSYVHGSEGNLLSVQDDFQAELRKLQEEHRDSLFFVPDKFSRIASTGEQINNNVDLDENRRLMDSPSERLFKELNSTTELKPANQVYNVFSVTIDNISPVHAVKLNEIINLEEPNTFVPYEVPKLCDIIRNNSANLLSECPVEVVEDFISNERLQGCRLKTVGDSSSEKQVRRVEKDMDDEDEDDTTVRVNLEQQFETEDESIDVLSNCSSSDPCGRDCNLQEETFNVNCAVSPMSNSFGDILADGELNHNSLHADDVELQLVANNHEEASVNVCKAEEENILDKDENHELLEDRPKEKNNYSNRDSKPSNSPLVVEDSNTNATTVDPLCFLKGQGDKSEVIISASLKNSIVQSSMLEETFVVDQEAQLPENSVNHIGSLENLKEPQPLSVQVVAPESGREVSSDNGHLPHPREMTSEINVPDRLEDNLTELETNFDAELSVQISEKSETQSENIKDNSELATSEQFLDCERGANKFVFEEKEKKTSLDSEAQTCDSEFVDKRETSFQNRLENSSNRKKLHQVPKLIELIENDDRLMDYIIANYESELRDDLSCDNSRKTNCPRLDAVANVDNMEHSDRVPVVDFDTSDSQDSTNPNSLTHLNAFSSLRTKHLSLDFAASTPTKMARPSLGDGSAELNYSLETWDNFIGTAIDSQNRSMDNQTFVFESLEPRSLVYLEEGDGRSATTTPPNSDTEDNSLEVNNVDGTVVLRDSDLNGTYEVAKEELNQTYEVAKDELNSTYDVDGLNSTFTADNTERSDASGNWDSSGGWFLHPQSGAAISGNLTERKDNNASYVRFGMDEEILAALRGELLAKLPHAQGTSSEKVKENDDDWDPSEKDEVFLRYNVYNTPLSPIPEESDTECSDNSLYSSRGSSDSGASDDWPEKFLDGTCVVAAQDAESQAQGRHRHTPSQDSCCSNDTLFNLEDMTCVDQREDGETKAEKLSESDKTEELLRTEAINYFKYGTALGTGQESPLMDLESPMEQLPDKSYLMDFLVKEREHSEMIFVVVTEPQYDSQSDSNSSKSVPLNKNNVAPLPSPDDHPWKQLSASLLSLDRSQKKGLLDLERKQSEDTDTTYVNGDCDANEMVSNHSINYLTAVSRDSSETDIENLRVNEVRCENCPVVESVPVNEAIDSKNVVVNGEGGLFYENAKVNEGKVEYCSIEDLPEYLTVSVYDCEVEKRSDYENVNVNDRYRKSSPDYENANVNDGDVESSPDYENVTVNDANVVNCPDYENVRPVEMHHRSGPNPLQANEKEMDEGTNEIYDNIENVGNVINEEDYVSITNLENCKMNVEFGQTEKIDADETRTEDYRIEDGDLVPRAAEGEEDSKDDALFGVLTDIRFSGPGGEPHLMSTSFSESNNDERDWDSGSDTRSSSSGEFIWKEGEHEESLKALQALPQDPLDVGAKEGNREESSSESSCSDEEGECPEFIPSAWDKYATPTKSALRSPEKTLEKEEKKGVWFKKQRYHCVYEYPREPDSPVLQSFDLWNNTPPATSYPYCYFDIDSGSDFNEFTNSNFQDGDTLSTDFSAGFNDKFYVTSSATPFDMMACSTSQFFPGDHWSDAAKLAENTTPDSGVEDATPGSLERIDLAGIGRTPKTELPSLKFLAEAAYSKAHLLAEKQSRSNEILGGLRHTRNKLKLDLPPSPNTFTANKSFNLEAIAEPIVLRERPSFTTFGKSRFLVQHVDTPERDPAGKNVCFEALPYKPPDAPPITASRAKKTKRNGEKGEASLLDSADEDSGIESSTLERRSANATAKLIVDL